MNWRQAFSNLATGRPGYNPDPSLCRHPVSTGGVYRRLCEHEPERPQAPPAPRAYPCPHGDWRPAEVVRMLPPSPSYVVEICGRCGSARRAWLPAEVVEP